MPRKSAVASTMTRLAGFATVVMVVFTLGCPGLFPPDPNEPNEPNEPNMAEPNEPNEPNMAEPNEPNEPNEPEPGNSGLTGKFIGSQRCALCHVNTHSNWDQTLHAGALETLEAIGQDKNATCLPCHTVGLGETGGFVDRATTNDLAGVGCESCHGAARDHVENIEDRTLLPDVNIMSSLCGRCHTGEHHPTYEEWQEAGHSMIDEHVAEGFQAGQEGRLNSCGACHSGDYFYLSTLQNEVVADDLLAGLAFEDMAKVECAICHDPHMKTGLAAEPDDGRDFQLRFAEIQNPTATNTTAAATDKTRFNLCGQCHHSRGRDWTAGSRGPHHSIQSNVYAGEMPTPDGDNPEPLVFSRVSVHSFAPEQCATCHMYREDFQDENAPAIAGHSFAVNQNSCAISGCHPSMEQALAVQETLQMEIQDRLDSVKAALDAWGDWEYSSSGGAGSDVPDEIAKARFLYYYSANDGSLGMHNPAYVRDMLIEAEAQVAAAPAAP